MILKMQQPDVSASESTEIICDPPSARVNFSIVTHPYKEECFIFGGEFFNGSKTTVYGNFYSYNFAKNEFKELKSSVCPSARSSTQVRLFEIEKIMKILKSYF